MENKAKKKKINWDAQIKRAEKELMWNKTMIENTYKGTASGKKSEYRIKTKRKNGVSS